MGVTEEDYASSSSCSDDSDLEWSANRAPCAMLPQVTADDEFTHFNKHVFRMEKLSADSHVRRTVHISLSATALMWLFLVVASLFSAGLWPQPSDSYVRTLGSISCLGWPDPRFSARRLACSDRDHIYIANRYQIYQVGSNGMTLVSCSSLDSTHFSIVDMTAWCDEAGCRPLLLRNGVAGTLPVVVDCRTGSEKPLQGVPATFIAAYGDGKSLLAVQGDMLVMHQWTAEAWVPVYDLSSISISTVASITVSGDTLLVFHKYPRKLFQKSVDLYDVRTMEPLGTWRVPGNVLPLMGGCGIDNGSSAIVVPSSIDSVDVATKALAIIQA